MTAEAVNWKGLYLAEHGKISRLINRIIKNRAATEDIAHDTFVNLMGRGKDDAIEDYGAFLARVARNLAIDHKRQERRKGSDLELFLLVDPAPSQETVLADRQALALTLAIIAELPPTQRRAFEMHRLGEHTLAQIAAALGISTAHAGRLVMQGYRTVRDRLRDHECA